MQHKAIARIFAESVFWEIGFYLNCRVAAIELGQKKFHLMEPGKLM